MRWTTSRTSCSASARIVASNPNLRSALSDRAATGAAKAGLVHELLDGRAHAVTARLVARLVATAAWS